jgi:hypothetical protein
MEYLLHLLVQLLRRELRIAAREIGSGSGTSLIIRLCLLAESPPEP